MATHFFNYYAPSSCFRFTRYLSTSFPMGHYCLWAFQCGQNEIVIHKAKWRLIFK